MNGACADGRDLRHLAEQLDVGRRVVEVVVADERAERLAAELAVLFLVQLLEERRLVPGRALVALQRLAEILLGDRHHADLQRLVGLGVVHHVVQSAPCRLELLEVLVMQDQVDLLGHLAVERGDHRLDAGHRVGADQLDVRQRLLRQRLDRGLDGRLGLVGLGLEFLVEQRREVVALDGDARKGAADCCSSSAMLTCSDGLGGSGVGFGLARRPSSDCSRAGSLRTLLISSSAPPLPSM